MEEKKKIKVKCDFCKKYHTITFSDYYVCPSTIECSTPWYLVATSNEVRQTKNFKNVKSWLGLFQIAGF